MEPHSIQEFHVLDGVAPVVVAIVFTVGSSLIKEPNRRNFMAIMIAAFSGPSAGFSVYDDRNTQMCIPVKMKEEW